MPRYGEWQSSRIGGGGYVMDTVITDADPNIYYTYTDAGGLYRSDDRGESWRMLHGTLPAKRGNYSVRGLSVDPRDADRLIIATGNRYARGDGLLESRDGGQTWNNILEPWLNFNGNGLSRSMGSVLVRHPANPDVLIAASLATGVWRTQDNGQTWTNTGLEQINPVDVVFNREDPDEVWLCASPASFKVNGKDAVGGFFRSNNGGESWTKLSDEGPIEIVQDPIDAHVIYGMYKKGNLLATRDAGETWTEHNDGLPIDENAKPTSLSPHHFRAIGTGPDFVLLGARDGSIYRMPAGGSVWTKIDRQSVTGPDGENRSRNFGWAMSSLTVNPQDPSHWLSTDFAGVYVTHDAGQNWVAAMNGIEETVIHQVVQDPTDPNVVHMGMADNAYFRSDNGGKTFTRYKFPKAAITCKDIALSPKQPARIYALGTELYDQQIKQLFISNDRGTSWKASPMLGMPDLSRRMATSLAVDPRDPNVVFVTVSGKVEPGGGWVYRSEDGGQRFESMSDGLPSESVFWPMQWVQGREIAVGPDGALLAISGKLGRTYRYDAATQTWRENDDAKGGQPYSISADLTTPGRFYVGILRKGIFRTDDSGRTWKQVDKRSVTHITADHATAGRVAASTDNGVILSTDAGETWTALDKSLPDRVQGNMPAFAGDRLIVGSYGSGVFWINLDRAGRERVR